jgi:hypothetical protein
VIREPVYLLSDDADEKPHMALQVYQANNGDFYLSILPKGHKIGPKVRLSTSGGAATRCPKGVDAVHRLYDAIAGMERPDA